MDVDVHHSRDQILPSAVDMPRGLHGAATHLGDAIALDHDAEVRLGGASRPVDERDIRERHLSGEMRDRLRLLEHQPLVEHALGLELFHDLVVFDLRQQGFRVVSGGTDTHLLLVDVFAKGVRGKEAETALDEAYITVNKNAIPFDVNPPLNPSGIRLGSPAVTTRGFREPEMRQVAALIAEALNGVQSKETLLAVRRRVMELAERFPLYPWKLARTTA